MYNIAMRLLMKNDEEKYKAVLDKYPPLCEKGAKTQITQKECEDLLCEIGTFNGVQLLILALLTHILITWVSC